MIRRQNSFAHLYYQNVLYANDDALVCSCRKDLVLAARMCNKVTVELGSIPKMELPKLVSLVLDGGG